MVPAVVPHEPVLRTQREPCMESVETGVVVPMPTLPLPVTLRNELQADPVPYRLPTSNTVELRASQRFPTTMPLLSAASVCMKTWDAQVPLGKFNVTLVPETTESFDCGVVVPMPTLPVLVTTTLGVLVAPGVSAVLNANPP